MSRKRIFIRFAFHSRACIKHLIKILDNNSSSSQAFRRKIKGHSYLDPYFLSLPLNVPFEAFTPFHWPPPPFLSFNVPFEDLHHFYWLPLYLTFQCTVWKSSLWLEYAHDELILQYSKEYRCSLELNFPVLLWRHSRWTPRTRWCHGRPIRIYLIIN